MTIGAHSASAVAMALAASFTWFAVQTIETARAKRGEKCRDASAVNLTFLAASGIRRGDIVGTQVTM